MFVVKNRWGSLVSHSSRSAAFQFVTSFSEMKRMDCSFKCITEPLLYNLYRSNTCLAPLLVVNCYRINPVSFSNIHAPRVKQCGETPGTDSAVNKMN